MDGDADHLDRAGSAGRLPNRCHRPARPRRFAPDTSASATPTWSVPWWYYRRAGAAGRPDPSRAAGRAGGLHRQFRRRAGRRPVHGRGRAGAHQPLDPALDRHRASARCGGHGMPWCSPPPWSRPCGAPPGAPPTARAGGARGVDEVPSAPRSARVAWFGRYGCAEGPMPRDWNGAETPGSETGLWVRDEPPRPLDYASSTALCDTFYPACGCAAPP